MGQQQGQGLPYLPAHPPQHEALSSGLQNSSSSDRKWTGAEDFLLVILCLLFRSLPRDFSSYRIEQHHAESKILTKKRGLGMQGEAGQSLPLPRLSPALPHLAVDPALL